MDLALFPFYQSCYLFQLPVIQHPIALTKRKKGVQSVPRNTGLFVAAMALHMEMNAPPKRPA